MKILFSFLLILAYWSSLAMGYICCDVGGKVFFPDPGQSCGSHRQYPKPFCADMIYFG